MCGPFFFRFPIGDRHTAYEWAMALCDRHPYRPPHFGDNIKAATLVGMDNRESVLRIYANTIYRALKAEFKAGRLEPMRREWCTDHRDVLDFTRCVYSLEQVLPIIQRRGDTGWLIGKLLVADCGVARALGGTALWPEREKAGDLPVSTEPQPALPPPSPIAVEQLKERRGHYITFLEIFMLALPQEAASWSDRAITNKFVGEWPSLGGEGKLPHKRYVDVQVEKLRKNFKKRWNNL
jgi:hypothetical protein